MCLQMLLINVTRAGQRACVCFLFIANYDLFCGVCSYIFLGSILATFVPFTLGVDLIQLRFQCNPNYVMCSHKI